MKRIFITVLALCLLLPGCTQGQSRQQQYTATYLHLFDTVTTVIGRDESKTAFQEKANAIRDALQRYHQLFDIYNDYEGIANIKTINDNAGIAPVKVDQAIIALLVDCKEYYRLTDGRVNVAMGGVLALWHDARNNGIQDPADAKLPDMAALQAAAEHMDLAQVLIDTEASTVYIADPQVRLDVGAIAKGWAAQRVAENAPGGMLLSVGGNVCATGPKQPDGTPWVIGVQDPSDPEQNVHTLYLTQGSLVTSGDYQRTYTVAGESYHHIIDPQTLMPAAVWRSVTVLCADSALADALSTGLFLMDQTQGQRLAEECGAQVLWIAQDGTEYMTPGFESQLRS